MLKLIRKGKVKDIYELDKEHLIFDFSNRISAFDVILPTEIPRKGEILCKFAEYWFKKLNVPNHMVNVIDKSKMVVKKLDIIPIESVVRGYIYGSYYERIINNEFPFSGKPILAAKLVSPIFDPTTKFEEKDRPISLNDIINNRWLSKEELDSIIKLSFYLYKSISEIVEKKGFLISDIKFEFGRDKNGKILLADSLGPDEFRLWSKDKYVIGKKQESFDKQIVRDWLIKNNYKKKLDEARKNKYPIPNPPILPESVVNEIIDRYIYTFEQITGKKLN